ncbi:MULTISPECIES: LysR family transcriptional regulator [unclassified Bradyrhizobium]|uniref:LysR family transcriptional regulator n=1 Tax=unclassified Bradyrhizobium TaxID=2631580 RepID=UPI001CD6B8FB|nr:MULTISPECIES: LysR family transcriptional regulator [unclassified Bradyrhizobium]MCA1386013.1 LysR family transcriptional regulator [Bradyrhizobium sp. BRP05]MCA1393811.1 LysR family transcriptional regulator [Bradyrhizobium sp. IC3123]MCA1423455.1 LysR family transcriptional regulator [Bradyrhizobium sp. BRP23]MCA1430651.1 LysR family transcriptional regulator [Bradyrhizobium sp. NBAIM16]MCA1480163.1 LysR family transcriptional regulator [Bradyrhizobium sp. NBAIM08]
MFILAPEQTVAAQDDEVPLNAIRAFVTVAREGSVTRAATTLRTTQSSVSRYLSVLRDYLGADLIERRGRRSDLTEFGRLFANAVSEPLETVGFTAKRMRRRADAGTNRIVVRTSLSTFASSFLIPNLQTFSSEVGDVIVDVVSSLSPPASSDDFDILITRDLSIVEPADSWEIYNEELVCVGPPNLVAGREFSIVRSTPILNITSRPDILPTWLRAMNMSSNDIRPGARYDHNYLALPAVMTGKCLLVAPEIIVSDLVRGGALQIIPGSRAQSGMQYRAYAVDRSENPEIARSFCRWVARLCKKAALAQHT